MLFFSGSAAENINCLPTNCILNANDYYILYDENLTWYQSSNKCRKHGGVLASIKDFPFFKNLLEKSRLQLDSHTKLWTSGTNLIWKNGKCFIRNTCTCISNIFIWKKIFRSLSLICAI